MSPFPSTFLLTGMSYTPEASAVMGSLQLTSINLQECRHKPDAGVKAL